MIPLIDGDILRYEVGFAAETGWRGFHPESLDPPPWDYVAEMLHGRISEVCRAVGATVEPLIYLTGKGNFREQIAKKAKYKGTRDSLKKPWHYNNLTAYLIGHFNAQVVDGIEADDAICIEQETNITEKFDMFNPEDHVDTIICTRDKDLRQCPGWHFGWELGNQPQFGPEFVDEIGYINLVKNNKEIKGVGSKFFYSQIITGDKTDNIPGLPGRGPKFAYDLLQACNTVSEMEQAVANAYKEKYADTWKEEMLEQAQLLWMVRELDEEGKPVMFEMKYA